MDWKNIKTLTEFEAQNIVAGYIDNHGYKATKIDTKKLPAGQKSPDLYVKQNDEMVFYCEVKTPELKLNPATNMYHWDTTFYKLRRFIHTAKKQFLDQDSKHSYPWVIAITSNHPQLNWTNFTHNIQGAVAYNGNVIRDFSNLSFLKDSNKDVLSIDLFLWFQINYINRKSIVQFKQFMNVDSALISHVQKISNLLTPKPGEGIKP